MTNNLQIITPSQCRSARELLNWNQKKLSDKSKISQSTISRFELANSRSMSEFKIGTILDLVNTFKKAKITFINENGKIGVILG